MGIALQVSAIELAASAPCMFPIHTADSIKGLGPATSRCVYIPVQNQRL